MPRPLLILGILGTSLAVVTQTGSTASNSLPSSTAVHRATSVSGATMVSLKYTITGSRITGLTTTLRGTRLLNAGVTAHFVGDVAVLCTQVSLSLLDALSGVREGTYTCGPLLESADRPARLQITVS